MTKRKKDKRTNKILQSTKHHNLIHDVSPGLQEEKHNRCHMQSRNCLPFRSTCIHPRI
jgi:hypothetical protein